MSLTCNALEWLSIGTLKISLTIEFQINMNSQAERNTRETARMSQRIKTTTDMNNPTVKLLAKDGVPSRLTTQRCQRCKEMMVTEEKLSPR